MLNKKTNVMIEVPVGSYIVDSSRVYKCIEDDCFHGCKDCAFCVALCEGGVCVAPKYLFCSSSLRYDGKNVRFEDVGELFSINGKEV